MFIERIDGNIDGDAGARELIERDPNLLHEIPLSGERPDDVDTREDYERLSGR